MLTGIHFILTYTCNFECDHCFLYCSPRAQGTFTVGQLTKALDEARNIGSVEWIFYEGGEPLLYFPLLLEGIRMAKRKGFKVGVVTNAYGAISKEDARLWLRPLAASGVSFLNVSDDTFHFGDKHETPAAIAHTVANELGIKTSPICIDPPRVVDQDSKAKKKGYPVIGGGAMFRGRAVEKLAANLPLRPWETLKKCPYEDLEDPSRVHIDPFGNVHICQGISMGNMWVTPLSKLASNYRPLDHPICGPLIRGGPAELAKATGVQPEPGYIDECHLCYLTRKAIIDRHPDFLVPRQVYGLE